ncbi:MAG: ATP-grasp domain-containing protein [Planctomycetales bacterium]|nr:ATP-grasp domain-containing protein [Planctomycetales bacterium]
MKIGVFEWVCSGGVDGVVENVNNGQQACCSGDHFTASSSRRSSNEVEHNELHKLFREGRAMLETVSLGLSSAGFDVIVPIAQGLQESIGAVAANSLSLRVLSPESSDIQQSVLNHWGLIARDCDLVVAIAPECDQILQHCIASLQSDVGQQNVRALLCNCTGRFLRYASCKWLTAQAFKTVGIRHPPTQRLDAVDCEWIESTRACCRILDGSARWLIKPFDGADCDGIRLCDANELLAATAKALEQREASPANIIVQPYLSGQSFSCSAFVSPSGSVTWLPLTEQRIELVEHVRGFGLKYCGGEVLPSAPVDPSLANVLEGALKACSPGAAGMVGFDLVCEDPGREWTLVEINPRFTTSIVGLQAAYSGNLLAELIEIWQVQESRLRSAGKLSSQIGLRSQIELRGTFDSCSFSAAGDITNRLCP